MLPEGGPSRPRRPKGDEDSPHITPGNSRDQDQARGHSRGRPAKRDVQREPGRYRRDSPGRSSSMDVFIDWVATLPRISVEPKKLPARYRRSSVSKEEENIGLREFREHHVPVQPKEVPARSRPYDAGDDTHWQKLQIPVERKEVHREPRGVPVELRPGRSDGERQERRPRRRESPTKDVTFALPRYGVTAFLWFLLFVELLIVKHLRMRCFVYLQLFDLPWHCSEHLFKFIEMPSYLRISKRSRPRRDQSSSRRPGYARALSPRRGRSASPPPRRLRSNQRRESSPAPNKRPKFSWIDLIPIGLGLLLSYLEERKGQKVLSRREEHHHHRRPDRGQSRRPSAPLRYESSRDQDRPRARIQCPRRSERHPARIHSDEHGELPGPRRHSSRPRPQGQAESADPRRQ